MATSQYTTNAVIPVGSAYDTTTYILGETFPDNTVELIPKISDAQFSVLQNTSTYNILYKLYQVDKRRLLQWNGAKWIELNNSTASHLVSNTASAQTVIEIDNTNPPTAGQALVAVSPTKAVWSDVSSGGSTPAPVNASFVQLIGNGSSTLITVTHNLNTESVLVSVWETTGSKQETDCTISIVDANSISLHFTNPPAANSLKVVIVSSVFSNAQQPTPPSVEWPPQAGNEGKVLTTDGSNPYWGTSNAGTSLPSQTNMSGKFLGTDGINPLWSDPIPDVSSNNDKYLYTNGSTYFWRSAPTEIPSMVGNSGYFLSTNGTIAEWAILPPWMANPMKAAGDLIIGGTDGAAGKLPIGVSGQSLTVIDGTTVGWKTLIPDTTGQTGKILESTGSGTTWSSISQVPTMSSNTTGKLLSNDGSNATWITNTNPPSISGNGGKFLTNDGTNVSWSLINQVPSISGSTASKLLSNDGASYYWTNLTSLFPSMSNNSGKYLTTDGSGISWATPPSGSSIWGSISGTLSNQADLYQALEGKASSSHGHAIGDVAGLATELGAIETNAATLATTVSGKADSSHVHPEREVSGLIADLAARITDAPSDGKTYGRKDAAWTEVTGGSGGGGGGGSLIKLTEITLTADQAEVSFTDISQIYKNLKIMYLARGTVAAYGTDMKLTINGDTGANYRRTYQYTHGSSGAGYANDLNVGFIAGASNAAGGVSIGNISLPFYADTTFFKNVDAFDVSCLDNYSGNTEILRVGGQWRSISAVNSLLLAPASGSFLAGSKFVLYGEDGEGSSSGSLGDTFSYFDPDKPPASPSSLDDEFEGTSLDAKWTTVNWSSASMKDVNTSTPGCLYLQSNGLDYVIPAILQPLPAGDFTIVTKVQNQSEAASSSNVGGGLILTNGVTAGAGAQHLLMTRTYSNGQTWLLAWSKFNASGTVVFARTEQAHYLRLRRSGTTYYSGTSWDGKTWTEQTFTPAITPTYCGLFQYCNQTGDGHTTFEFFRYFNSAAASNGGTRNVGTDAFVLGRQKVQTTSYQSVTAAIPFDDTIPQATEGTQLLAVNYTPKKASSTIKVRALVNLYAASGIQNTVALFVDSGADAVAATAWVANSGSIIQAVPLEFDYENTTLNTKAFALRVGPASGTMKVNGGSSQRFLGGTVVSWLEVTEYGG